MRIDTTLVDPLRTLPTGSFGGPTCPRRPAPNLAFRNLTRAKMVKLATGQQMATFLKNKGVDAHEADARRRSATAATAPTSTA